MSSQRMRDFTGLRVPQARGTIVTAAPDEYTFRTKRDRADAVSMSLQHTRGLLRFDIPEAYGVIVAPGGDEQPIRAESYRFDAIRMTNQRAVRSSRGQRPYAA